LIAKKTICSLWCKCYANLIKAAVIYKGTPKGFANFL
jgi:hypothetical protein